MNPKTVFIASALSCAITTFSAYSAEYQSSFDKNPEGKQYIALAWLTIEPNRTNMNSSTAEGYVKDLLASGDSYSNSRYARFLIKNIARNTINENEIRAIELLGEANIFSNNYPTPLTEMQSFFTSNPPILSANSSRALTKLLNYTTKEETNDPRIAEIAKILRERRN